MIGFSPSWPLSSPLRPRTWSACRARSATLISRSAAEKYCSAIASDCADELRLRQRLVRRFDASRGIKNVLRGDLRLVTRDLLAVAVAHQCVQDRMKMPRRQLVARRQCFRRDRTGGRIDRNVDHGYNGKSAHVRDERHLFRPSNLARRDSDIFCGARCRLPIAWG